MGVSVPSTGAYLRLNDTPLDGGDFSIGFWHDFVSAAGWQDILHIGQDATQTANPWNLIGVDSSGYLFFGNNGSYTQIGTLSNGNKYYIVLSQSSGVLNVRVFDDSSDETPIYDVDPSETINGSESSLDWLVIGEVYSGEYMRGAVEALRIHHGVVWSNADARAESQSYDPVTGGGLVWGNWHLAYLRATERGYLDSSGYGHDFTPTSASSTTTHPTQLDPYEYITSVGYGTGYDYSSVDAWESGEQGNLPQLNDIRTAECYGDAGGWFDTTGVTISGWTTDATHYPEIRAAAGEAHAGVLDNTKAHIYLSGAAGSANVEVVEQYFRLINMQVFRYGSDDNSYFGIHASDSANTANGLRVDGCIIAGNFELTVTYGDNLFGIALGQDQTAGPTAYISNNLIYGWEAVSGSGGAGIRIPVNWNDAYAYIYNNTIIGCRTGIFDSSGYNTGLVKNNLVAQCSVACFSAVGWYAGSDFNASDDGTAPGSGSNLYAEFTFVDAANDDYHLALDDVGARGLGVDLSGDAYPITTDFEGDARNASSPDIGADEGAILVEKTVGFGGTAYDYSSLNAWEAGEQGDLVAANELRSAVCYGFRDTTATAVAGATVDAQRYRRVVAAVGAEAQSPYDESGSAYRIEISSSSTTLDVEEDYARIGRIQLAQSGSGYCLRLGTSSNIQGVLVDGAILKGPWNASANYTPGIRSEVGGAVNIVRNCLAFGFDGSGSGISAGFTHGGSGTLTMQNCTAVGCWHGFRRFGGTMNCYNCLAADTQGGVCFSGTIGGDYNASDDATATMGSYSITSAVFTFVDETGRDFRLSRDDAYALGAGTDLSDDFDWDALGYHRHQWDIGAFSVRDRLFVHEVALTDLGNGADPDIPAWTPEPDTWYIVTVIQERGSYTDPPDPDLSGNGISWRKIGSNVYADTFSTHARITTWVGKSDSPTAGVTSIDTGAVATDVAYMIDVGLGWHPTRLLQCGNVGTGKGTGAVEVYLPDNFADPYLHGAYYVGATSGAATWTPESGWAELAASETVTLLNTISIGSGWAEGEWPYVQWYTPSGSESGGLAFEVADDNRPVRTGKVFVKQSNGGGNFYSGNSLQVTVPDDADLILAFFSMSYPTNLATDIQWDGVSMEMLAEQDDVGSGYGGTLCVWYMDKNSSGWKTGTYNITPYFTDGGGAEATLTVVCYRRVHPSVPFPAIAEQVAQYASPTTLDVDNCTADEIVIGAISKQAAGANETLTPGAAQAKPVSRINTSNAFLANIVRIGEQRGLATQSLSWTQSNTTRGIAAIAFRLAGIEDTSPGTVTDAFTDSNNVSMPDHDRAWEILTTGDVFVYGNRARGDGFNSWRIARRVSGLSPSSGRQYAQAVNKGAWTNTRYAAVGIFLTDDDGAGVDGYVFAVDTDSCHLFRFDDGAPTQLDTAAIGFADADVLKISIREGIIACYKNGVVVCSAVDTTYTRGEPGVGFNFNSAEELDDFQAGDILGVDVTRHLDDGVATSVSSQAIASEELVTGRVYYLIVGNDLDIATPTLPTVSGWTQVATETATWGRTRLTIFRKVGDGSFGATIDYGAVVQDRVQWSLEEATVVNLTTPEIAANSQTDSGNGTAATVTFDAITDSLNAFLFAVFVPGAQTSVTEEAGWTENYLEATNYRLGVIWAGGGADVTPLYTLADVATWRGVGIEIAAEGVEGGGGAALVQVVSETIRTRRVRRFVVTD